jgi:hypothetical protein
MRLTKSEIGAALPAQFLTHLNSLFLQALPVLLGLTVLLWLSARASYRFIETFPDDVPEKAELLAGARAQWLMWWPLLAFGVLYAVLVFLLAPLTAIAAAFIVGFVPFLIALFHNQPALDAPFAAAEVLRARRRREPPDPERWLATYRKVKERRRRLGLLRYVMLVLVLALAGIGAWGYVTVDRVLAVRLQAIAMEDDIKQALGLQVTVFTQTPPCVPACTLYLIPPPGMKAPEAKQLIVKTQQALQQRGERRAWRIEVKTGEGPLLAEGEYSPPARPMQSRSR